MATKVVVNGTSLIRKAPLTTKRRKIMTSYVTRAAMDKMNGHIDRMLEQSDSTEKPLEDLCWDITKAILEDGDCSCLDYDTITEAVCAKVNKPN